MATNQPKRYIGNLIYPDKLKPTQILGNFAAGSTQAVKMGEILELTGNTNTEWVPLNSDYAPNSDAAIAAVEIKDGDRAGYYPIFLICPGDVWEYDLAAAGASAVGTSLYYSDSETLTISAGSNPIAEIVGQENYPEQGHLASFDGQGDAGTTIRNLSKVRVTFLLAFSYYLILQG